MRRKYPSTIHKRRVCACTDGTTVRRIYLIPALDGNLLRSGRLWWGGGGKRDNSSLRIGEGYYVLCTLTRRPIVIVRDEMQRSKRRRKIHFVFSVFFDWYVTGWTQSQRLCSLVPVRTVFILFHYNFECA